MLGLIDNSFLINRRHVLFDLRFTVLCQSSGFKKARFDEEREMQQKNQIEYVTIIGNSFEEVVAES